MSRWRAEPVSHATWFADRLNLWGWNGEHTADRAWLYRAFNRDVTTDQPQWPYAPTSFGSLARLWLELDDDHHLWASCISLRPAAAATWLAPTPAGVSDSIAWMARVAELAQQLVIAHRVAPVLEIDGDADAMSATARWGALAGPEIDPLLDALDAAMPAVIAAGRTPIMDPGTIGGIDTLGGSGDDGSADQPIRAGTIVDRFVDDIIRTQLAARRIRLDLPRRRHPTTTAIRSTFTALSRPDPTVAVSDRSARDHLMALERTLGRARRRVIGATELVPQLRLVPPPDPSEPWAVVLEVVDLDDPGRWCSAAEIWERTPAAIALATDTDTGPPDDRGVLDRLDALGTVVLSAAECCAAAIRPLDEWAGQDRPTEVLISTDDLDVFLEQATEQLGGLGIELLGPELLVNTTPRVRGEARPAPADDRRSHFGAEAVIDWSVSIDGQPLSETELARAVASGSTLLHTGHRWVRIDPAVLRRARAQLERRQQQPRASATDLLNYLDSDDLEVVLDASRPDDLGSSLFGPDWIATLFGGLDDERLAEAPEPEGFKGALRPYQRRGLGWLEFLASMGLGGCLADDMGLGKTATALAHLLARPGPHLVICPLSVVHNWEAEAARFAPSLQVEVHHGNDRTLSSTDDGAVAADVVITTYGLIARDVDLHSVRWSTVVIDEAQMIKNPNTKVARATRSLIADQKVALTGTPVENRLVELWSILDTVVPGLLGSQQRFRERYAMPIERFGSESVAERLRTLTGPFVLRRTKADRRLVPDLPDKIEQIAYASLTHEQAVLYGEVTDQLLNEVDHLEGMQRQGRVLAALTRLKQICNHPAHALADGSRLDGRSGKLERFDELLADLLGLDERALVFTQFTEMGALLQRHLAERFSITAEFLHGGVSRSQRQAMISRFDTGGGPPVLLLSLKAGGTGLNLTTATQVIHYDRWWNPAVEDQATDRAWRIGQHRTVHVHKLVCEGTIEERISTVIDDKRRLADTVIGSAENWLADLNTDELRRLVMLEHQQPSPTERHRARRAAAGVDHGVRGGAR